MDEKKLHDCDCGCGCDCEHDHEHDCDCGCEEEEIVELFDESGKGYKFVHIGGTQFDNKWYVVFLPAEEIEGLDSQSVVIFEAGEEKEDGSADLVPITDEELLNAVFEQFCNEQEELASAMEAQELEGGDCDCDDCDDDCDDCDDEE